MDFSGVKFDLFIFNSESAGYLNVGHVSGMSVRALNRSQK